MRTEKINGILGDLEKYKVKSLNCDECVTEKWLHHILDKNTLPDIVVWRNEIIIGGNIVNVLKNISKFSLQVYEIRRVRDYDVSVIFVDDASYKEVALYKCL